MRSMDSRQAWHQHWPLSLPSTSKPAPQSARVHPRRAANSSNQHGTGAVHPARSVAHAHSHSLEQTCSTNTSAAVQAQNSRSRRSALQLTQAITAATTLSELLRVLSRRQPSDINGIHVNAAFRRMVLLQGQLGRQEATAPFAASQPASHAVPGSQMSTSNDALHLLHLLYSLVQPRVQSMGAREAAGVLWAAASLQHHPGNAALTVLVQVS